MTQPAPAVAPQNAPSSPITRLGPAWHKRVHGVDVLKLKGSFHDMGFQHGSLLADRVASGPITYFRDHLERMVARDLGRFTPAALAALRHGVGRRVAKGLPPFALETLTGLAQGANLPLEAFLDGCTMPDALMWVVARVIDLRMRGPALHHRMALGLGCTSVMAWGDATADGQLYHARNLDYHGVGNWPDHTAVLFHQPDQGQRYVSVAAAGVALGGSTAMNEAGLTLTVHQHMFTNTTTLGGTPVGVVGDLVMRQAETLDDAQKILAEHKPIGCWTYLVADGKTQEVLCVEENPQRNAARRIRGKDTFGYANIYLDPQLGSTEQNLYGSYWRHNLGRHQRANALLEQQRGSLDAAGMAAIIGDRGDPRCRIHDSIAMVMTVGSVVLRPHDGTVWVGTGQAPSSRGTYVPFSLGREDAAVQEPTFRLQDNETAQQAGGFESFRRAYVAYVDDQDTPAARTHMHQAATQCPDQPVYHAVHGLLALSQGDAAGAGASFTQALTLGHPDFERVAAFYLWRARSRDLAGQRALARADYRATLALHADGPVHAAARMGLWRPFNASRAARINIEFSLGDVINP